MTEEESHNNFFKAMELCRIDAKGERGIEGTIECPACKGTLHYSIAGTNGHMWGRCETKDCLTWMS